MKRRRRLLVLCLAGSISLAIMGALILWPSVEPVPLNGQLRHDAVVLVVGWIVEDRALPSFHESYVDAEIMEDIRRFHVACDFLPTSERISNDPRVVRITAKEIKTMFGKADFTWDDDDNDYLLLTILEEGNDHIKIGMSNWFGELAAHGYEFTFRIVGGRLKVDVKFLWVS